MFVMKMPPRKRKKRSLEVLFLLLVVGLNFSDAQMISEEDNWPSADQGSHGTAFFALRSCHQVLGGDRGQFFSPDYLCSNPPLWCNWTIQVHPGKRIHLHLSDLTPDDGCHWRRDQIHIDEPEGPGQKHSILQKCWGEATYTSSSNTVYVVLLIEGSPMLTYRGFHGRYQTFGLPEHYNPENPSPSPSGLSQNTDDVVNYIDEETVDTNLQSQESSVTEGEADELLISDSDVLPTETTAEETVSPDLQREQRPSPRANGAIRRNAEETVTVSSETPDRTTGQSENGKPEEAPQSNANQNQKRDRNGLPEGGRRVGRKEPQSDHRADMRADAKPHRPSPHVPGDLLFEVSVEVNVSRDAGKWNDVAHTLLFAVKTLLRNQLQTTLLSQNIASKRIKRLSSGALFILWLQMGQRTSDRQARDVVHSSLQRLIGSRLGFRQDHQDSIIMSLSTADVNECDSQLMACDPNADCENHFGSYSCQCRPDFQDLSRSGAGTVCVNMNNTGCSGPLSSEAKAVYVLFFLLSTLVLSLLVLFALLYHRHRRGHFVPPCDPNNNVSSSGHHDDTDLPPPPPPRCPPVDLQLLRYNTILSHEPKA